MNKQVRDILESKPNELTYKEAFVALTKIASASHEHAEAVRDVMDTLSRFEGLRQLVEMTANQRNVENLAHNLRICADRAEALNPTPDFAD